MELCIDNIHAVAHGKKILQGFSLTVRSGEIHAIMGPNGAGKSTLAKIIAGHPGYEIEQGDITLNGQSILDMEPNERAHLGIFMSFQYPIEIPGVTNFEFLQAAYNAHQKARGEPLLNEEAFETHVLNIMEKLRIPSDFLRRDVNGGFSGGEKKRNEILQMALLNPTISILDETDSGLDIDAMKVVADGVNAHMGESRGLILITHYERLLHYIQPDYVHVVMNGKVITSGDASLAKKLERLGYDWVEGECQHL